MNRRGFLTALLAPIVARFAPKKKPTTGGLFNPHANVSAQWDSVVTRINLATGEYTREYKSSGIAWTVIERSRFDVCPIVPMRLVHPVWLKSDGVDSAAHSSLESMMDAGAANETSWNEAQETAVL